MKRLFLLALLQIIAQQSLANYSATEINFEYNRTKNRVFIQIRAWRICNDWPDPLLNQIRVDMPGCGSFTVNTTLTTISDKSLYKYRYPKEACIKPNNRTIGVTGRGVEEFVSTGSFALDTAPFVNAPANGCCKIYFSINGTFFRPQGITTGITGPFNNYAMMDICNIMASKHDVYRSPRFIQAHHTDILQCNQRHTIDLGLNQTYNDSVSCMLSPALGTSRFNTIMPNSPLTFLSPINTYCPPGLSSPCSPIPHADPPIGFHVDEKKGTLTFTPTACISQTGIAVLEVSGYVTDTNGVIKQVSTIRRDFVLSIRNTGNNQPYLEGPYDLFVPIGDTLSKLIHSRDDIVIVPPPGTPSSSDTTEFIIINSDPILQVTVEDSSVRERQLRFSLIADSAAAAKKHFTSYIIVTDQDSLYPGRNSYAYNVYITQKLNLSLQINKLNCGFVCVKVLGDSINMARYHQTNGQLVLSKDSIILGKYGSLTDSFIFQLRENGNYNIRLIDNGHPNWNISVKDSFNYQNGIFKILGFNGKGTICYKGDSTHIKTNHLNTTGTKTKFEWSLTRRNQADSIIFRDSILKTQSPGWYKGKIMAGGCVDSGFTYVGKIYPRKGVFRVLERCVQNCDSIDLSYYTSQFHYYNSIDSFYATRTNNQKLLKLNSYRWTTCNSYPNGFPNKDTIIIKYRSVGEHCFWEDSLVINFNKDSILFRDTTFCANNGLIHLNSLSPNSSTFTSPFIQFKAFQNNVEQPMQFITTRGDSTYEYLLDRKGRMGSFKITYQYTLNGCNRLDSFNINILNIPEVKSKYDKVAFCERTNPYGLGVFNPDTVIKFNVSSINGIAFTGSQDSMIANRSFLKTDAPGNYKIYLHKEDINGCKSYDSANIIVNKNPKFSLGPDIDVNNFDLISLVAPANMASYLWNVNNFRGQILTGYPKDIWLDSGKNEIICTITDRNFCRSSDTILIQYRTSNVYLTKSNFKIYPNPSNGNITIKGDEEIRAIKIISNVGKEVWVQKFDTNLKQQHINPQVPLNGSYMILIYAVEGIYSGKQVWMSK